MSDFARFQLSGSLGSRLTGPSCVVKTPGENRTMTYVQSNRALFLACLHHQRSSPSMMSLRPLTSSPSRLSNVTGQGIFSAFLFDLYPNRPIESIVTTKINVTPLPAYHSANSKHQYVLLTSFVRKSCIPGSIVHKPCRCSYWTTALNPERIDPAWSPTLKPNRISVQEKTARLLLQLWRTAGDGNSDIAFPHDMSIIFSIPLLWITLLHRIEL
jgi:hypothetical protein